MSSNHKRCSSGNTRIPSKQISTLPRSKTCGVSNTTPVKSKPERLQPIVTNNNSQLNDTKLLDEINTPHPAMVNELSLHARGLFTIPNLSEFSKLQILDLSCNNLTRIDNLRNLSNLRELKLYGNKIERIENLECLTQLQILQLQYNEIQTIGSSLVYLTRLQTLRIDSNKLSQIRSDEILKLVQLKILDVSDCSIENLDFLNTLSSITEFRACHCGLKSLPNQFRNLRYLIDLDLSNNDLTNITSLKHLQSLRILHLSNNSIQDIQILSNLIHLNELHLDNNQINLIPNSFDKLIDLQCLSLANNRIKSLNDIDIIRRMNSLFILNINGNPFISQMDNYIEELSKYCPSLEIIDDISVTNNNLNEGDVDEQLMNIDKELKQVDQTLEKSISDIQEQFAVILNDLHKLNSPNTETIDNSANKKSKYRLFQALTFSEENYQDSNNV